jgi:hypothetical protein
LTSSTPVESLLPSGPNGDKLIDFHDFTDKEIEQIPFLHSRSALVVVLQPKGIATNADRYTCRFEQTEFGWQMTDWARKSLLVNGSRTGNAKTNDALRKLWCPQNRQSAANEI